MSAPTIAAIDVIPLVKPGDIVCEIGCRKGVSTQAFAMAGARVFTIDPWKDYEGYNVPEHRDSYSIAVSKLAVFGNRVTILKMMSTEALPYIPMCDLIWIDGNHEYKYIHQDIKDYWKKVKVGGYLSGDDYSWPGVEKAVINCGLIFQVIGRSWVIKKEIGYPEEL